MRGLLVRLKDNARRFMMGRYGMDDLNRFLYGLFIVLFILELLLPFAGVKSFLGLANTLVVFLELFRMLSRNIPKRYEENLKFLEKTAGLRRFVRVSRRRFQDRKEYRYFKCPGCGQVTRVPRGKGHIRISCPKCGASFVRKA